MWTLYEGDCLEVMKILPDRSIDMILCDLPYGTTTCKWDVIIPLEPLWAQYKRVIKDNGAIVLTAQTPFDKILGASNLKLLRYEWIWIKEEGTGFLNAKKRPLKAHENILIFYKKAPIYNPQFKTGKPYRRTRNKVKTNSVYRENATRDGYIAINEGIRCPITVLHFNREYGLHPTQKPVALFEYLIRTYTNEGDTVLDNCAGSGTTGVACENTGRNSILIEKDPKYCNIIRERM